ncbi:tyrosine-type recombinase/integrase [Streptomyces eurythermus]
MASVVSRKNAAGEITSYQVKWRLGGGRTAPWQTERFPPDDEGLDAAEIFKEAVDEAGQQWPAGWVKGQGYIDPGAATPDGLRYRFDNYARESIQNRTASLRYKHGRLRELENYIFPTFGTCDVRSTEHFSKATVQAWINKMRTTKVKRGSKLKLMSSQTLRGLHGLLSSVLNEAVVAEPPLRDRNPCDLTRLPKDDDRGASDHESTDEMEFMTPEEIAGLVDCFPKAADRLFVRFLYGTGLRWGEVTALAAKHVRSPSAGRYEVRVTRAWKRDVMPPHPDVWRLGPPKSRAGRRTVEITAGLWQELIDFGLSSLRSDDLLFPNGNGTRLPYSTFYDRWLAAVKEAKRRGVLPEWKKPTVHDLRHSHVAALLSDGHSLTYVQRRLGHESIKTTSDRYGHLLETAHKAALNTLDRVLSIRSPRPGEMPENPQWVYTVLTGGRILGFWRELDAEEIAERMVRERGASALVEKWSTDRWIETKRGRDSESDGLAEVRTDLPARAFIWMAGPGVYAVDGRDLRSEPRVADARGVWVWDFEEEFTKEPACGTAEWSLSQGETVARAWGTDREAVLAAYETARAEAIRLCDSHPDRIAQGREPGA